MTTCLYLSSPKNLLGLREHLCWQGTSASSNIIEESLRGLNSVCSQTHLELDTARDKLPLHLIA